jgi:UDP-glucose 4-epimerase
MNKILITGGFGYLGGRLGQYLLESGYEVFLASRKNNIDAPEWLRKAIVKHVDWDDDRSLDQICTDIDVVIHAAGMNSKDCADDPIKALLFNGVSTSNLITSAIKKKVKKFIYLSTAHVYSSPLVGVITEDSQTYNKHPYATSHMAGETALIAADQRKEIDGIILRLSNVFGAPVHRNVDCWMLLVNDLCRQVAVSGKMELNSSGLQVRNFVSMTDFCRVVDYLINFNNKQPEASVLNVGGENLTVIEMASLIQKCCMNSFGIRVIIERPEPVAGESIHHIDYRMNWLSSTDLKLVMDSEKEIKRVLDFCLSNFS